jgi:hypothetical protein
MSDWGLTRLNADAPHAGAQRAAGYLTRWASAF